jgi:hypothetical protein
MAEIDRAARKAQKKAAKSQKKAAKKQYERNHAQLKRQQAFTSGTLAAQVKRGKKQAKSET